MLAQASHPNYDARPSASIFSQRPSGSRFPHGFSRSRLCLAVWCTPGFLRLAGMWANRLTFMSRTRPKELRSANRARFTPMGIRKSVFSLLVLGAAGMYAADADLNSAIAKNRMGTLVIRTAPGARVAVDQVRHEFWFGATLPGGIFSGRNTPEDIAKWKQIFTSHFSAGVPEADLK